MLGLEVRLRLANQLEELGLIPFEGLEVPQITAPWFVTLPWTLHTSTGDINFEVPLP